MVYWYLYFSLDIEVSVILAPDDDNYEKLTEETRLLLINFDPTAGRHIKRTTEEGDDNYDDVHSYTAQNQFFRCVRQGFESEGLKIEIPNMLKELGLKNPVLLCNIFMISYVSFRGMQGFGRLR